MAINEEQKLKVEQFVELTRVTAEIAEHYLSKFSWDLEESVTAYYIQVTANEDDNDQEMPSDEAEELLNQSRATSTANPTSISKPTTTTKPSKKPNSYNSSSSSSKIKTFSDLNKGNSDNDSDDDNKDTNFFTGGEKSALQVEDPNKKKKNNPISLAEELIKKAMEEGSKPDTRTPINGGAGDDSKGKNKFKGTGYQLGSVDNDVKSKVFKDPKESNSSGFKVAEKVVRTITFWKEGFQVGDGDLYKYDDPQNAEYLRQLNSGRAPLSLLDVEMFQDVDVNVVKKMDESFKPSKKKPAGFTGSGQRLGSPVPYEPTPIIEEDKKVDEKKEDIKSETETQTETQTGDASVQIRLANGTRLIQKFNSTDDISTVFKFVRNVSSNDRDWQLAFAFPLQIIDENSGKSIKEAGLVNSVIVQRWK
ncbi:hypothetical protein CANARDRAFT_7392 [[Candida] arabinofermentans NRRL YB-2248]|uniref:UBX domain-containing protein n=1 Tax=[Candida] arabinofermentans NRRL YB-2248 TaxID=983967 RepID=A0A1E4T2Q7_9ASCO|nr:hypothetical protein CANARDRAFT_7392 [[Candida] arabinofermentans NRRL YB-2248]